ncbi:uncharacterized protein METZ01_LOCUS187418, partial [marine metagenome]
VPACWLGSLQRFWSVHTSGLQRFDRPIGLRP